MSVLIEVCIDSLESLPIAQRAGAGRIELCSSLATGGLTASAGYMKHAARIATVPVYGIIRPREGDFLYSSDDVDIMLEDIHTAKLAGLNGVVIGALGADGKIDEVAVKAMINAASGMGITFHRAIDHCSAPFEALEFLMAHGVERVLTSGLAKRADEGINTLKDMVKLTQGRLSIMPGAGVSPENAKRIIVETGATEIHLSGKTTRPSLMSYRNEKATMGSGESDFAITVTNPDTILHMVAALQ
ncbi:copper homeostasis protein CutC [Enterovibrio norvegicus]|uniref:PF03932 family protein CutC n=1 Tax=Enterovibrio norvegicus FF-454 TaxID=1185651 RepID=A0A1E5C2X3_9GAMM|nr:copper homeostasis protein CutC [Enterovibrio norvegicus]OEE59835.1 copper homeostasis protein CutC [Enterovibrio norvegicus FF-454]OEE88008.1 copper homeostasis protein CutC [Enterovibrio norvegicus FF-162]